MALSAAQKNKICQLLGYGGLALDAGSIIYDSILVGRLTDISAATETFVVSLLGSVDTVETQISQAPARTISLQVGDIKINPEELKLLRSERKILAREISQLLDIPMVSGGGGVNIPVRV